MEAAIVADEAESLFRTDTASCRDCNRNSSLTSYHYLCHAPLDSTKGLRIKGNAFDNCGNSGRDLAANLRLILRGSLMRTA